MSDDPPFSPKQLAERWGCTRQFIHKLMRKGEIKAFKLGRLVKRAGAAHNPSVLARILSK
jgi:excisionase family DNA binding protein